MTIPSPGRVLGLDWGVRRIGIAISDETQLIASALATLTRRTGRRLPLKSMLELIETRAPVGIVVGLPLGDDGMEGLPAIAAREMGRVVAAKTNLPVDWIDESFTTARTLATLRQSGRSARGANVDALAAAELLQQWLDQRQPERPR
jgi:putative Holliday junction resolvase